MLASAVFFYGKGNTSDDSSPASLFDAYDLIKDLVGQGACFYDWERLQFSYLRRSCDLIRCCAVGRWSGELDFIILFEESFLTCFVPELLPYRDGCWPSCL